MRFAIVHHHYRPGGVRRVIELATPHLLRALGNGPHEVVLVGGEAPDENWLQRFRRSLGAASLSVFVEPVFGYLSEQPAAAAAVARRCRQGVQRLLAGRADCVVWAHNLGLARNLLLTRELIGACETRRIPLVAHHHDWWFENRWQRWPEMRRAGFRSLAHVGRILFGSPTLRHVAINRADTLLLARELGRRATWLPNPCEPGHGPSAARVRFARAWLRERFGDDAPVWLLPCRLLRRKNIAEALLLTRWLRPEAWLATTGAVSSADEEAYAARLAAAAREHRWRLRLGILGGDDAREPAVPELLAASEAVLLTSLQEGFGLPYLEAVAARRPLIARALPNIASDLARFGFRFPQCYDELLVDTRLLDWPAERRRQTRFYRDWLAGLPRACRKLVKPPALLSSPHARRVPFSRLTLTAQIEVLAQPLERSWALCAPLNPWLGSWRRRAAAGALKTGAWPPSADRWLGGRAYGRRFLEALAADPADASRPADPRRCLENFMRARLRPACLYPLLWTADT